MKYLSFKGSFSESSRSAKLSQFNIYTFSSSGQHNERKSLDRPTSFTEALLNSMVILQSFQESHLSPLSIELEIAGGDTEDSPIVIVNIHTVQ